MTKQNAIVVALLMLVIGGGAGFFAGTAYQKTQGPSMEKGFTFSEGGPQGGAVRSGGNMVKSGFQPVNGEIVAADETSITVKMEDGSSKIILFSDATAITKSNAGSSADLKTGEKVLVVGEKNSDGSVAAQTIQLNPAERMLMQSKN